MRIQVTGVMVPMGSTIGFGRGFPEGDETKLVHFVGDARPMMELAIAGALADAMDESIVVDVPDWAILDIEELP